MIRLLFWAHHIVYRDVAVGVMKWITSQFIEQVQYILRMGICFHVQCGVGIFYQLVTIVAIFAAHRNRNRLLLRPKKQW